jgi:hypothetical protein
MTLRRAAIVAPIRTAVGKFGGALATMNAGELGAVIIKAALVERTGIDPARVDDVVFAQGHGNLHAHASPDRDADQCRMLAEQEKSDLAAMLETQMGLTCPSANGAPSPVTGYPSIAALRLLRQIDSAVGFRTCEALQTVVGNIQARSN